MSAGGARLGPLRRALAWLWARWRELRAWRRIRFTRAGLIFTVGAFAVGFAAINTGNNLLYLLMGAMLGLMGLSGWLSEQVIRGVEVERHVPVGTPVGRDVRIRYRVRNLKRRLPSLGLELKEEGLEGRAFFARVPPDGSAEGRASNRFVKRGIYPLEILTLTTTFPFGLFRKERDLVLPGEIVIWPRHDRPVREPRPGGGRRRDRGASALAAAGHAGEYRSLREYRPGDAPRDIHWRRSARLDTPVVREYEQEGARAVWICLDTGGPADDTAEELVEIAASLVARSVREGRRVGAVVGGRTVGPGAGPGVLEGALDALARVDFHPSDPVPAAPTDPVRCVLVSRTGRGRNSFGDVILASEDTA